MSTSRTIVRADGSELTLSEARELTPQEAQERAERCAVLDRQVRQAVRDVRRAWWTLAQALVEFREAHAWSTLGYSTLTDYLQDPAVDVRESTFYALTRAYEQFAGRGVDSRRLESLDWTKVHEVVPALASARVTVDRALDDAGSLSLRELRVKYGAEPEPDTTPHEARAGADGTSTISADPVDEQADEVEIAARVAEAKKLMVEARHSGASYPRVSCDVLDVGILALEFALASPGTFEEFCEPGAPGGDDDGACRRTCPYLATKVFWAPSPAATASASCPVFLGVFGCAAPR